MANQTTAFIYTTTLLNAVISTGAGGAKQSVAAPKTYQASGTTTNATGAATIQVQGSVDGVGWDTIGTITLSLSTTAASDSFSSDDRYPIVRGNVTALSGTGAAVSLTMGH